VFTVDANLVILAASFGAGFVNAVAGGGTLLTFPALLYSGLPSITANATSTVALCPSSVMSSWAYRGYLAKSWDRALALVLPSLLGGITGAVLLLSTPEKVFRFIVPYLIFLACALLIAQEPMGRWVTAASQVHRRKHAIALWLAHFAISVYGGYFGAGIGILMIATLAIFLPDDLQAINGLKNFFGLLINSMAALYFLVVGAAVYKVVLLMAGAAVVGGFVGARTAQKLSPRVLRTVIVTYGLAVGVYLLNKG
jgi:uncharacterized protein